MKSNAVGKVLGYGFAAASLVGFGVMTYLGLQRDNYHDALLNLKKEGETAIVQKYQGTPALDELVRSYGGLQLQHSGVDVIAVTNISQALAEGCNTQQSIQSPVCEDYSQIRTMLLAEQAAFNSQDRRMTLEVIIAAFSGTMLTLLSLGSLLFSDNSSVSAERRQQNGSRNTSQA